MKGITMTFISLFFWITLFGSDNIIIEVPSFFLSIFFMIGGFAKLEDGN